MLWFKNKERDDGDRVFIEANKAPLTLKPNSRPPRRAIDALKAELNELKAEVERKRFIPPKTNRDITTT
jgi:hypothetical protein